MRIGLLHIIHFNYSAVCKHISIAILLIFFVTASMSAQTTAASENQVKAVFLFNFTHFVDWPSSAFEYPYEPFIIGIIGNDPFGSLIESTIEGERIGTHLIKINRYKTIQDIQKCHILYIATQDPDETKKIINAVADKDILTVGDSPNFIRWGGMIRFYKEENKIRLQINNSAAKAAGLKISSKLLRVAQVS